MQRIQIVKDALEGEYDEFYDDYVSGKKELAELNREYSGLDIHLREGGNRGRQF